MTDRTNTDHALDLLRGRVDALLEERDALKEKLSELRAAAFELFGLLADAGDLDGVAYTPAGREALDRMYQLRREG